MTLSSDRPPSPPPSLDAALALACTLPPSARDGRRVDLHNLLAHGRLWGGLDDGVLIEFPGAEATVRRLLDFVFAERLCCPRFTYELSFAPEAGPVTLRIHASVGDLKALRAMFAGLVDPETAPLRRSNADRDK